MKTGDGELGREDGGRKTGNRPPSSVFDPPSSLLITIAISLTLLYIAALAFDPGRTLVLWERAPQFDWGSTWPLALGLGGYAVAIWAILRRLPERPSRKQIGLILVGVFVAGLALQTAAVHVVEPYPLRGTLIRQLSPFTGGYWNVGARVDQFGQFLDQFAEQMPSYSVHAQRHPPGLPLIFWLGRVVFEAWPGLASAIAAPVRPMACFDPLAAQLNDAQIASGVFGVVIESAMAWLIPIALFFFMRKVASVRVALLAALLYPLVPGALAWASQFDRGFGLITVLGLYGCERMVDSSQRQSLNPVTSLLTGIVFSIGTFFSVGNVPIILIGALYMAVRIWQQERLAQWRLRVLQAVLVLIGIASVWVLCLPFGFDPIGMYRATMQTHLELDRPFWPFVVWHAWDIITFIGIPFVVLGLGALWQRGRPQQALAVAGFGTLLILCLAHVARGETGRVWMFFAPVVVGVAALLWMEDRGRQTEDNKGQMNGATIRFSVIILALLALQSLAQIGWLRVIGYGTDPATVADAAVPSEATPANVRYGRSGEVHLLGLQTTPTLKAGDYADTTLYWQLDSTQALTRSYKIFVHYTPDLDDKVRVVNQDSIPMNWTLPTTCWRPGQIVQDRHGVRIDPNAAPGEYLMLVGLYEETSGEREYVHTAERAKDFAVEMPIKIRVAQ